MEIFGIRLVGVNVENGQKLLLTLAFLLLMYFLYRAFDGLTRRVLRRHHEEQVRFWRRQAINIVLATVLILGLLSIWFDDPTRLATALGLITAGLAFALQKVVTAVAGYFVILRGNTFTVGDRITMGGVRGDVVGLGFIQTTIMEMGQPPAVQKADPAMWVQSRQYTGRVVTVSNDKIFDEPVYNYSRDFPFLWEEIRVPITYTSDCERAERILLETAERHSSEFAETSRRAFRQMQDHYFVQSTSMEPKVYYRLTDNWLELTVRFVVPTHGIRDLKDLMSREILKAFDEAGIGIASATIEIVGFPPLRLRNGALESRDAT